MSGSIALMSRGGPVAQGTDVGWIVLVTGLHRNERCGMWGFTATDGGNTAPCLLGMGLERRLGEDFTTPCYLRVASSMVFLGKLVLIHGDVLDWDMSTEAGPVIRRALWGSTPDGRWFLPDLMNRAGKP